MNEENQILCIKLQVAYEIIAKVHEELCMKYPRELGLVQDSLEVLGAIIRFESKLGGEKNANCT